LLLDQPSNYDADFAVRLFNADGGETPISGNGTRCVGAYLYLVEKWQQPEVRIATCAGIKTLKPVERHDNGLVFETMMGTPHFRSQDIPIILPQPLDRVIRQPLDVAGEQIEITATSMGNPHCSILLNQDEDFDSIDWRKLGAAIETHQAFPARTNVEFIRVLNRDEIEVRFWERGCGETLASGTGSCGAALAVMLNELTERKIKILTAAGELIVEWRDDNTILQTGEARAVYYGEWFAQS
jgi:diaminopimelate epimerase